MKTKKNVLTVAIAILLFSACAPLKPIEILKTESATLRNLSGETAEVEIKLLINNPNKQSFKVSGADLNLKLSGKDVGKGKLKNKVKIKGNTQDSYTFVVMGKRSNLMEGGISALSDILNKRGVKLNVEGTVTGKKMGIKQSFPINENMTLPMLK